MVARRPLAGAASSAGAVLPGSEVVAQLGMASPTYAAVVVGDVLATGHADGSVRLSDPAAGTVLRVLGGHRGQVRAVSADPQGHWLASAAHATIHLWSPTTGELAVTLVASEDGWAALASRGLL